MRPGLLCPGKSAIDADAMSAMPGFNEAGAVMPRKELVNWWLTLRDHGLQ